MFLRGRISGPAVLLIFLALIAIQPSQSSAQQSTAVRGKALTIERIYSQPSLSGRMTRGLTWTPDGKQLGYFETKGSGKGRRVRSLRRRQGLDAAPLRNINGRLMAVAFCFKVPRHLHGWI